MVTLFHRNNNKDKINDTLNDTLNNIEKTILRIIKVNKYVTQKEIAEKCKVSIETIKRNIKNMQKNNILQRIGSRKSSHWRIIE